MTDATQGWRGIESAPRDGTRVLLTGWWENDPETGHRWTCDGYWGASDDDWFEHIDREQSRIALVPPTHWQPLPAPPASGSVRDE